MKLVKNGRERRGGATIADVTGQRDCNKVRQHVDGALMKVSFHHSSGAQTLFVVCTVGKRFVRPGHIYKTHNTRLMVMLYTNNVCNTPT